MIAQHVRNGLRALALAAVVAVAMAGCGSSGSGPATGAPGSGATGAASLRWQAHTAGTGTLATWLYGNDLVVAGDTAVTAFDRASGRVMWKLTPPAGAAFCGASTSAANGKVAVGVGALPPGPVPQPDCHSVAVVDLAAGRPDWIQSVPAPSQLPQGALAGIAPHGLMAGIDGDTVVAAWQGIYSAFAVSGGARRWSALLPGASRPSDARVYDVAPAGATTYLTAMATFGGVPAVLAVSTATGRVERQITMPPGMTGLHNPGSVIFAGTSPPAVILTDELSSAGAIVLVNTQLTAAHAIRSGSASAQRPVPGKDLLLTDVANNHQARGTYPVLEGGGMLFAVTTPTDSPPASSLYAYDAATGERKWSASVAGTDIVAPVAVDGSVLIAQGVDEVGHGDPVTIRIDLTTGKVLSTHTVSTSGASQMGGLLSFYNYTWDGRHIYAVDWNGAVTNSLPTVLALG